VETSSTTRWLDLFCGSWWFDVPKLHPFMNPYTLWLTNIIWKITIFHGKIRYKWPFSIAMLNYQRVIHLGGLNSFELHRISTYEH
jgi:hypothetical protein